MSRGENPDVIEEMVLDNNELEQQAYKEFERYINDKTRLNDKELIIEAYEGVLLNARTGEKDMLNSRRFKEYEKNRQPKDKWYEMKTKGFSKELFRNKVALKPNNWNA